MTVNSYQVPLTGGQDLLVSANKLRIFLQLYVDTGFAYIGNASVTASIGCRVDPGIYYNYRDPESAMELYAFGSSGKIHVLEITK